MVVTMPPSTTTTGITIRHTIGNTATTAPDLYGGEARSGGELQSCGDDGSWSADNTVPTAEVGIGASASSA